MSVESNTPVGSAENHAVNSVQYEKHSKAKAIGWFSGGSKGRITLKDIDNFVIKIAAEQITNSQQPVTTTFFLKTHARVKIQNEDYDVNISSLAKRLGITKEDVNKLIANNKNDLTTFFSNLKENLTELKNSIESQFQGSESVAVKNVTDFLAQKKAELVKQASKDHKHEYNIGDFVVTVEKNSIKLSKQGSENFIILDPSDPLKTLSHSEQYLDSLKQELAKKCNISPYGCVSIFEKIKEKRAENFTGTIKMDVSLNDNTNSKKKLTITFDESGKVTIKLDIAHIDFDTKQITPTNEGKLLNLLESPNITQLNFLDFFEVLKPLDSQKLNLYLDKLKKKFGDDLFLKFATFCAIAEISREDPNSILRGQSITISIYKLWMDEQIGTKLKKVTDDFFKQNDTLKNAQYEEQTDANSPKQLTANFQFIAKEKIPQFFDSIKEIVEKLPEPLKKYHQDLRDAALELFRKNPNPSLGTPEERADKFIITPLFLRILAPHINNEINAAAASSLIQNMANQISISKKENEWSFFADTIKKMQENGKFTEFAKALLPPPQTL
jgi:hypothetical protein